MMSKRKTKTQVGIKHQEMENYSLAECTIKAKVRMLRGQLNPNFYRGDDTRR
uniref:Uncharacterized protein n=1 Tax=Arion vulgaris TaxID=1028688 RepID=A0A0B6Z1M7_9EUPU